MSGIGLINNAISPGLQAVQQPGSSSASNPASSAFSNLVDTLNPLQHIPILSGLYRAATGSSISNTAQVAGDTLYGAAIGFGIGGVVSGLVSSFASSVGNVAVRQTTGSDVESHVMSALGMGQSTSNANAAGFTVAGPAAGQAQLNAQLSSALARIYPGPQNISYINTQYQRTQMFDSMNQSLLKVKT